jgi:hypothetical protein
MTHIFDKAINQLASFTLWDWALFIVIAAWFIRWAYDLLKDNN